MHDDSDRTTAIGLARYAAEFHEAAGGADSALGHKPGFEIVAPIPVMYLIGHSMELSLKAFLVHNGVGLRELRTEFRHDLHKCLEKAKELGLLGQVKFDDHELAAFSDLDHLYSTKQLEYIVTGSKQFPMYGYLHTMSEKLLATICPIVGYNR